MQENSHSEMEPCWGEIVQDNHIIITSLKVLQSPFLSNLLKWKAQEKKSSLFTEANGFSLAVSCIGMLAGANWLTWNPA